MKHHPQTKHSKALIRACNEKAWYGSEAAARQIARDRLELNNDDRRLWPYPCAVCRQWHLTHSEQSNTVAVTRRERWEGAVR